MAGRTDASLLELLARRIVAYRQALADIRHAIRPDYCMGCRIVREVLDLIDP